MQLGEPGGFPSKSFSKGARRLVLSGRAETSVKLEPLPHRCWLSWSIWIHHSACYTHTNIHSLPLTHSCLWQNADTNQECPNMSRKHLTAWLCETAEISIMLVLKSGGQCADVLSTLNKLQTTYSQASTPQNISKYSAHHARRTATYAM